jgi:hypothetical protein
MANHVHLYLPYVEEQLDPRPHPCIDSSPMFDEEQQPYRHLEEGKQYDAALLRKRKLDVFSMATPMHVLGKFQKRRLGPASNAMMSQLHVDISLNPAPNQSSSGNLVANAEVEAEVDAMLFKVKRIMSKSRPPSWWYRMGSQSLKSIGPVNWPLTRRAIDYHQSWCLQQLYKDKDTVALVPYI